MMRCVYLIKVIKYLLTKIKNTTRLFTPFGFFLLLLSKIWFGVFLGGMFGRFSTLLLRI